MIHDTAVVEVFVPEDSYIWHWTHITDTARIGDRVSVGQCCFIAGTVGDGTRIGNGVSVWFGVELGEDVFVAPGAMFTNVMRPRAFFRQPAEETKVGRGATIGAGAVVVCGVEIGEYAMIGAGSVVTHDVPAYAIAYGNPARVVGRVDKRGHDG